MGGFFIMDARIVGVLELMRDEDVGIRGGDLAGALDGAGNTVRVGRQLKFGPQSQDEFLAFNAHPLGHDDAHPVTLHPPDQRQADARVTRGGLDDDRVRFQPPVALRPLEHGHSNPVLDAAAGIEELRLGEDPLTVELQQRRIPNKIKNVVG